MKTPKSEAPSRTLPPAATRSALSHSADAYLEILAELRRDQENDIIQTASRYMSPDAAALLPHEGDYGPPEPDTEVAPRRNLLARLRSNRRDPLRVMPVRKEPSLPERLVSALTEEQIDALVSADPAFASRLFARSFLHYETILAASLTIPAARSFEMTPNQSSAMNEVNMVVWRLDQDSSSQIRSAMVSDPVEIAGYEATCAALDEPVDPASLGPVKYGTFALKAMKAFKMAENWRQQVLPVMSAYETHARSIASTSPAVAPIALRLTDVHRQTRPQIASAVDSLRRAAEIDMALTTVGVLIWSKQAGPADLENRQRLQLIGSNIGDAFVAAAAADVDLHALTAFAKKQPLEIALQTLSQPAQDLEADGPAGPTMGLG